MTGDKETEVHSPPEVAGVDACGTGVDNLYTAEVPGTSPTFHRISAAVKPRPDTLDRVIHEVAVPAHLHDQPYLRAIYDHPRFSSATVRDDVHRGVAVAQRV
jgi:hypothetical protein